MYGDDDPDDEFSRKFIAWDRASPDGEAARIVTEIISSQVVLPGRIVRLSDEALKGAIRWMAVAISHSVAERARILKEAVSSRDEAVHRPFIEFLETSEALDDSEFRVAAQSF